jgi:non-heme chloroperoxidase
VDIEKPERVPLLIVSGEKDNTVPSAIANAPFKRRAHNPGVTEIVEMRNRGPVLTVDRGWREVADTALTFAHRCAQHRCPARGTGGTRSGL